MTEEQESNIRERIANLSAARANQLKASKLYEEAAIQHGKTKKGENFQSKSVHCKKEAAKLLNMIKKETRKVTAA